MNVHFHSLVFDGVYEVLPGSRGLRFLQLPPPDTSEVVRVLADTVGRMASALKRIGFGHGEEGDEGDDELARENPVLAALYAAAVQGRNAMGVEAGRRTARIGSEALAEGADAGFSRCAVLGGFSLHAGVSVRAADRAGLERLCRYMGRPALAGERLEALADGRILYRLRHRWRDGTSAVVFEPREFLARLAAQVPPPGAHQVRYHGVLAPCAAWRRYVVPTGEGSIDGAENAAGCPQGRPRVPKGRRIAWSDLLRRVFAVDALVCDRCGWRMRLMAAVRSPSAVAKFLACLGEAGRSPPAAEGGARA